MSARADFYHEIGASVFQAEGVLKNITLIDDNIP